MFKTVRSKLLFWILLPLLVVYGSVAVFETRRQVQVALDDATRLLRESVETRAARCDTEFAEVAAMLQTVLNWFADHPTPPETDVGPFLTRGVDNNQRLLGLGISYEANVFEPEKEFFEYYYYRNDKEIIVPQTETSDFEYRTRDWYVQAVKAQRSVWGEPYIGNFPVGVKMCSHSAPLFQGEKLFGVLIADLSLSEIEKIVQSDPPPKTWFTLVSPTGKIISDADDSLLIQESLFTLAGKASRDDFADYATKMLQGTEPLKRIVPLPSEFPSKKPMSDGQAFWFVAAPLKETGWTLLATTPESAILQPIYTRLWKQHLVFLFALVLIVGVVVAVTSRLAASLKRLTGFADELAKGNLDARINGNPSNDELGRLTRHFDKMVDDLKTNIDARMKESLARKAVEEELRVARRIQTSLLPHSFPPFPHRKEFELYAKNEPAAFIAGDFFDFFFLEENKLGIVIADVSGHGVPAAMFMAVARTALRNFAVPDQSPREMIRQTNEVLAKDNDDGMFVTAFFACYQVDTGDLTYVNAGHNPPYILREDRGLEPLSSTGTLLAAFGDIDFDERTVNIRRGDALVLFTDGVTEAHAEAFNYFSGEKRLETLLSALRGESVETIANVVLRNVEDHSQGERHDDVTIVVLKRN